jgi:hypothetical protein
MRGSRVPARDDALAAFLSSSHDIPVTESAASASTRAAAASVDTRAANVSTQRDGGIIGDIQMQGNAVTEAEGTLNVHADTSYSRALRDSIHAEASSSSAHAAQRQASPIKVNVQIGRIEVRGAPQERSARKAERAPSVSLDNYLSRFKGKGG